MSYFCAFCCKDKYIFKTVDMAFMKFVNHDTSHNVNIHNPRAGRNILGKYQPNMNKFCDWLSDTKVINVHDSFC